MSTNAKRKLAAIVFADIAGYTERSNRDESGTLQIRTQVERLLKSSTISHNGRVVKVLGDGAMLEFASAVDAVGCALEIQAQMAELNTSLELSDPALLRVGVHVGDVVEEADDLYGNAVNIASRVAGMAAPGGICITREVYVQIRPILNLRCDPVSETEGGRLPEPIEVFAIMGGDTPAPAVIRRSGSLSVVAMALVLVCAAGALGYYAYGARVVESDREMVARQDNAPVHRILLPDWVTPGEEFEIDAGPSAASLAVYYGNRRAETRVSDGKVVVRVPADLPTQQTTISVFEDGKSSPLLSQATQVIRSPMYAMNAPSGEATLDDATRDAPSAGSEGSVESTAKGPDVKVDSKSAATKPTVSPTSHSDDVPAPPKRPIPGAKIVRFEPPPGYEKLVTAVDSGDFEFKVADVPEVGAPEFQTAMKAVRLAANGDKEEARKMLVDVRVGMKTMDKQTAVEVESLVKSAEALMVKDAPGPQERAKWAEAFAFSINNRTKNFPGIAMLGHLIHAKKYDEASRAYRLLSVQPNLTAAEKKVLEKMGRQLELAKKEPPTPAAPPEGSPE